LPKSRKTNKEGMMLSCSCAYDDGGWYYYSTDKFNTLNSTRRKRCCSCNELIDIGSQCVEFDRYRSPYSDIEERIWGDEVGLASWYMCEKCGEIYLNLSSIGYCIMLGNNIKEDLEDYWDITGFSPVNK